MSRSAVRRNVLILALCQALTMTIMSISITVTALNGEELAPDPAWATIPLGLQAIATMAATMPASHLMQWRGRRFGFTLGAVIGMGGGALGVLAVVADSFWLLCLSNVFLGAMMGFGVFYRFAAAEASDEGYRSRAISLVLAGGVVSAVLGPNLSQYTRDVVAGHVYAGCYAAMIVVGLCVIALLPLTRIPTPTAAERRVGGRPTGVIVRQPATIVALLAGMIGYGVMSFLMTATPLAMKHHHFHFDDWSNVIEWHALGMFAPSFFTGRLIKRFGVLNILAVGALLLFAAAAADLAGLDFWNFWSGLFLLGVAWNFLYIGATSLLTETYRPEERARVEGLNDFLVFGTVAAASFVSGGLHSAFGWAAVNYGILPLVALTLGATIWLMGRRRRPLAAE
jgi:MFS family permease